MKILLILLLALGATLCNAQDYGRASFYGKKFQGRKMANGHKFDQNALTCASRKYHLGTWLSVYYPRTDRTVTVEVTDRGPWVKNRILDMSEKAAYVLGLHAYGVDFIFVTVLKGLSWPEKPLFWKLGENVTQDDTFYTLPTISTNMEGACNVVVPLACVLTKSNSVQEEISQH